MGMFAFIVLDLSGLVVSFALEFAGIPTATAMGVLLLFVVAGLGALAWGWHHLRRARNSVAARLGIDPSDAKRIDLRGRARFDATTQKLTRPPDWPPAI